MTTRSKPAIRKPWLYKGVWVHPVTQADSSIRWFAFMRWLDYPLRADTKQGMRQLIGLKKSGCPRP